MLDFNPAELQALLVMGGAMIGLLVILFALSVYQPRGTRYDRPTGRNSHANSGASDYHRTARKFN